MKKILEKWWRIPSWFSKFSLLFPILFALFFYRQIFLGEVFYCCDNLLINLPAKLFWVKELSFGRIPIDNPYLFSGTHFLADINLSALYPGNLLFFLFSPFRGITISILFHLFFTALGMYVLMKTLGLKKETAFLSSIIFVFSGTVVGYSGNLPMIQVVSILPWLFASWVFYVNSPSKRNLIFTIIFSVLQIFAGHVQLTYYSFLFCFIYALFFLKTSIKHKAVLLSGISLLIITISSIQLIPFLEFAFHTTRIGRGFAYASFGALPLSAPFRLLLPSLVGNVQNGTDWWQGGSMYGYIGAIPLLLAFVALKKAKAREYFFISMGLITFVAAFGASTPVFHLLYLFPGIGMFRVPSHFLLLTTFCFSILAGYGFEKIDLLKKINLFYGLGIACFITTGILYLGKHSFYAALQTLNVSKLQNKLAFWGEQGFYQLHQNIALNILFIGISFCILRFVFYKKGYRWTTILFLVFSDLFLFSRMNLLTISYTQVKEWEREQYSTIMQIHQIIQEEYRVYVHPSLYQSPYKKVFGQSWLDKEVHWQYQSFRPNLLMNHEILQVDGYASMIDANYQRKFGVNANDPTGVTIPDLAGEQLRQLGVRYVFFPANSNEENELIKQSDLIWKNEHLKIYELANVNEVVHTEKSVRPFQLGLLFSLVGVVTFVVLPKRLFTV